MARNPLPSGSPLYHDIPAARSSKQVIPKSHQTSHTETRPTYYKERYKYAKAQLRAAEKKSYEAQFDLEAARLEIIRLQRQQTDYLNKLVERSTSPTSPSYLKNDSLLLDSSAKASSSSKKRPYKPYEFLAKPEASMNPPKKSRSSLSVPDTKSPKTKKPRNKRDPEKARRVQPVSLNDDGSFSLPTQVSIFTIVSLGKVEYERPTFHSDRYILPIGYKVLRYYRSTINPDTQACYTSSILDGETGPKFQVVADDRPDEPFISDTPSGAWTQILKQASKVRNLQVANSGSGPEYYGLAHPTIAYMIQSLPNASRCKNYRWQSFEVQPPNSAQSRPWPAPPAPGALDSPSEPAPLEQGNDSPNRPVSLGHDNDSPISLAQALSPEHDNSSVEHDDSPIQTRFISEHVSPSQSLFDENHESPSYEREATPPKKMRIWD